MRVITIIKVMIVLFAILSAVNVISSMMVAGSIRNIEDALDRRIMTRNAIFDMRHSTARLTRVSRAYVVRGEDFQLDVYQSELDRFDVAVEAMFEIGITEEEQAIFAASMHYFDNMRIIEQTSFDIFHGGDYDLAFEIIYDTSYAANFVNFEIHLAQIDDSIIARTQVELDNEFRNSSLLGGLTQVTAVAFALISILGTAFILREVRAAFKRERDAHELNQEYLDSCPMFIELWDSADNMIDCNKQALNMLNVPSKEEYFANYDRFSPEFQPDGRPSSEAAAANNQIAFEEGYSRFEWMHNDYDGVPMPVEVTLVRINRHGKHYIIGYNHDLRQVKAAMETAQMAEEENRAKTQFLARMSHEIRTPMNAVLGITELQLQKDGHAPETEDAFLRIYSSSNLLLSIINDILDLSKVEAGKMEIVSAPYEVASMIVDTVQMNLIHKGSKTIDFKLLVDENMPEYLQGDELRIKQILNNILSNAFKYTQEGSVTLSVSSEDGVDGCKMLVFRITDTGQGMTDEETSRLFDAEYMRYNLVTNRTIEGSGLGMNIAYQLTTMMGGTIAIESEVGKGSTFILRVPQMPEGQSVLGKEAAESLQSLDISEKDLQRIASIEREPMPYGKVLVVDDVDSNLYVAKQLLLPYRLTVETVNSGADAVEKVRSGNEYDIIFMDHMMPGMDGLEATRRIRELEYKHPIVALTANTVKGTVELFEANGFSGFVSKPVDQRKLNAYLVRFIRDKQTSEVIESAKARYANDNTVIDTLNYAMRKTSLRDLQKALAALEPLVEILNNRKNLGREELKNFTIHVHSTKSILNNIGESALSGVARMLEDAGHSGNIEMIKSRVDYFIDCLVEVIKRLGAIDESDENDKDPTFIRDFMRGITTACESKNLQDATSVLDILSQQLCTKRTHALIGKISVALLKGKFDEAAELAELV